MKQIKLSGRERAVVRAMDFTNGSVGEELLYRTNLDPEDLVDTLNALVGLGYAEMVPPAEETTVAEFRTVLFEMNPSYAFELRAAIARL
ncbi:MAG: hypothetical protein JWL90_2771 [Chthoniobacteraceae bacterium]|nr:hypothetical protein [Chthoniobacteraceae bacterium]MDB6172432.1 hypothetical protein [Chthoniobacteraceae bacterium]